MKKMLSVVTALTVTMSSFGAFASFFEPGGITPFESDNNAIGPEGYRVPKNDAVVTDVKVQTSWNKEDGYSHHDTAGAALSKEYADKAETFDAQAILKMENVAKEWNSYINVATAYGISRSNAINAVDIEGEFVITITWDGTGTDASLVGIENKELEKKAENSGYQWLDVNGYKASDFFKMKSVDYADTDANGKRTFTLTMEVKDDLDKTALDSFFNQANDDNKVFKFEVEKNTVNGKNKPYEIKGEFKGYVTVSIGIAAGLTNSDVSSTVYFGDSNTYKMAEKDTHPVPATDVEYVKLYVDPGIIDDGPHHGGGGGGVSRPTPTPTPTPTVEPTETPSATPTVEPQTGGTDNGAKLDYDNHYAYIIGYPTDDGTKIVKPENNITRAEVATIFFRLLTDESRTKFWTTENDFSDVESADWYNNAISTAAQAGIVNGYEDGTFRPNNPITRAEFAAIASRFANVPFEGEDMFSDITGHWAADNINEATTVGWINGYEDGTFRPDRNITRAEAMTLINRVLYRYVEAEDLRDDMIKWDDNTADKWYYANVQEATNSHTYEREAIGTYEAWTAITEPRDWEALEKETSTAASAGKEESAFEGIDETEDASDVTMEEVVDEAANSADEATGVVTDDTADTTDETVDEATDASADEVVDETTDETTEEVVE